MTEWSIILFSCDAAEWCGAVVERVMQDCYKYYSQEIKLINLCSFVHFQYIQADIRIHVIQGCYCT